MAWKKSLKAIAGEAVCCRCFVALFVSSLVSLSLLLILMLLVSWYVVAVGCFGTGDADASERWENDTYIYFQQSYQYQIAGNHILYASPASLTTRGVVEEVVSQI